MKYDRDELPSEKESLLSLAEKLPVLPYSFCQLLVNETLTRSTPRP